MQAVIFSTTARPSTPPQAQWILPGGRRKSDMAVGPMAIGGSLMTAGPMTLGSSMAVQPPALCRQNQAPSIRRLRSPLLVAVGSTRAVGAMVVGQRTTASSVGGLQSPLQKQVPRPARPAIPCQPPSQKLKRWQSSRNASRTSSPITGGCQGESRSRLVLSACYSRP